MKKIKIFFSFLVCFIMISSCSTRIHYAEFIKPSDVYIPKTVRTILVINRGGAENDVAPIEALGQRVEDIKGLPKLSADSIIAGLKEVIGKLGRFQFVELDVPFSPTRTAQFMEDTLSREEIQAFCSAYPIDAIISLDGISVDITASNDVEVVSATDESGAVYNVPQFIGERKIDISVAWRIYDCKRGIVGDEYNADYSGLFTNRVATEEEVNAGLPGGIANVLEVASAAAIDYAMRIAPHWESDYRKYYQTGSQDLISASNLIYYDDNWEEASLIWSKLANNPNTEAKIKYRAMYNMALASEMLGKPELAKEWLQNAIAIKESNLAQKYLQQIEKQILIYEVVDEQLLPGNDEVNE